MASKMNRQKYVPVEQRHTQQPTAPSPNSSKVFGRGVEIGEKSLASTTKKKYAGSHSDARRRTLENRKAQADRSRSPSPELHAPSGSNSYPTPTILMDTRKAYRVWIDSYSSILDALKQSEEGLERACCVLLPRGIIQHQDYVNITTAAPGRIKRDRATELHRSLNIEYRSAESWMDIFKAVSQACPQGRDVVNNILVQLNIPQSALAGAETLVSQGREMVASHQVTLSERVTPGNFKDRTLARYSEILKCLEQSEDILTSVAKSLKEERFINEDDVEEISHTGTVINNRASTLWRMAQISATSSDRGMTIFLKALYNTDNSSCQKLVWLLAQETGIDPNAYLP